MNLLNKRLPWAARKILYDTIGFRPEEAQRGPLAETDARFIVFAGGVGAGKSLVAAKYLLPEVLPNSFRAILLEKAGYKVDKVEEYRKHFWMVGPDYMLSRRVFSLLHDDLSALGVDRSTCNMPMEGSWLMRFQDTKTEVETKSAGNPETFHSVPVQGVVLDEAALVSDWFRRERLIPRIMRGVVDGWMFCAGTFEGHNWLTTAYDLGQGENAEGWASFSMASWECHTNYPDISDETRAWLNWFCTDLPGGKVMEELTTKEALARLKDEADSLYYALVSMPADSFAQRFGARPQRPAGLVFPEFDARVHVKSDLTFDPDREVELAIDPGTENPYAVLAIQYRGEIVEVIDEVYYRHCTSEEIIAECLKRPWMKNVKGGQIDATQIEQRAVWQRGEIWERAGMKPPYLRAQKVLIPIGIERLRLWLRNPQDGKPRIFFSPKVVETIKEFGLHSYPKVKDGTEHNGLPTDKFNHSLKSLCYIIVGKFGIGTHYDALGNRTLEFRPRFPYR